MNFTEIARTRQSCRKYDPTRPIEQSKIDAILESARLAPSACNGQPYRLTLCRGEAAAQVANACMGMGMNMGGNMVNQMSQTNMAMAQAGVGVQNPNVAPQAVAGVAAGVAPQAPVNPAPQAAGWTCECGSVNTGKFCPECGKAMPVVTAEWTCECGSVNTGKFCPECGKPRA